MFQRVYFPGDPCQSRAEFKRYRGLEFHCMQFSIDFPKRGSSQFVGFFMYVHWLLVNAWKYFDFVVYTFHFPGGFESEFQTYKELEVPAVLLRLNYNLTMTPFLTLLNMQHLCRLAPNWNSNFFICLNFVLPNQSINHTWYLVCVKMRSDTHKHPARLKQRIDTTN